MEYYRDKKEIVCNKKLNNLDEFVLEFCSNLKEYVIVSGYVSIVFGRSRNTEDIDLLIPKMKLSDFIELFDNLLNKGFECMNTSNPKEAFEMLKEHAIRFYKKNNPIPNIEFKIIKNDLDRYSYENKIKIKLGNYFLFISPLEMQIAYKLFLSSEVADKDIEDARYLYKVFKEKIDKDKLILLSNKLNVEKRIEEIE